ncbi:MAG: hypothetical protein R3F19_00905 [Verrucomicrobiales bacterium]
MRSEISTSCAIADGTSQLTFTAGGVKISPTIPVYDLPAMAEYLRSQGTNEEQLAPYLDIDGDGFNALEEFGFGTKAGDGSSRPYIIGILVGNPGAPEQKFELVYPRRTGGSVNATNGYEVDGICYQPQGGGNLQEWDHLIERVPPSSNLPGLLVTNGSPPA